MKQVAPTLQHVLLRATLLMMAVFSGHLCHAILPAEPVNAKYSDAFSRKYTFKTDTGGVHVRRQDKGKAILRASMSLGDLDLTSITGATHISTSVSMTSGALTSTTFFDQQLSSDPNYQDGDLKATNAYSSPYQGKDLRYLVEAMSINPKTKVLTVTITMQLASELLDGMYEIAGASLYSNAFQDDLDSRKLVQPLRIGLRVINSSTTVAAGGTDGDFAAGVSVGITPVNAPVAGDFRNVKVKMKGPVHP